MRTCRLHRPYKILVVVLIPFLGSCERDTTITLRGEAPPSFVLSGSGRLEVLAIQGQKVRDSPKLAASTVWEIRAKAGPFSGTKVEWLGSITYGEVPDGYVQVYPEHGEAPPLLEGERYYASFDTTGANGAHIYFTIREGKAVELSPTSER